MTLLSRHLLECMGDFLFYNLASIFQPRLHTLTALLNCKDGKLLPLVTGLFTKLMLRTCYYAGVIGSIVEVNVLREAYDCTQDKQTCTVCFATSRYSQRKILDDENFRFNFWKISYATRHRAKYRSNFAYKTFWCDWLHRAEVKLKMVQYSWDKDRHIKHLEVRK